MPTKRAFKYDVAITAADFDALTVAELKRRLEQRLAKPVFVTPKGADKAPTATVTAAVRKSIEKDARVAVVLFQRLWGVSEWSAIEAAAIKARIGSTKKKDVVVVPIDNAQPPTWLKATFLKASDSPTSHAVVDAIVDAVAAAGGAPRRLTESAIAAHVADDEKRARARAAFLASQRAMALINRELDSLSSTVLKLCEAPGTLPEGFAAESRRTPDRYTVQIGPVGLSFSWIRGRSNAIADGQLLVIEWAGQLGDQAASVNAEGNGHGHGNGHGIGHTNAVTKTAMPAFEHVLQPHATSPEDWQWRRTDLDLCAYTTRDLAAQCVASVVKRLPAQ